MRAFNDSWEQAALLAQQATGGVIVEVDAEDTANTFEVDVVRKGVEIDLDVNVVTGRIIGDRQVARRRLSVDDDEVLGERACAGTKGKSQ